MLKLSDYMRYPGPRYKKLGPDSGEMLRDDIIWPLFAKDHDLVINLDVKGFGSSFLDEAFTGLVLNYGLKRSDIEFLLENLMCESDCTIVEEIREYINNVLSD
ncbi:STAS-like domain-containing protein [Marinomonas gallaica]|uniref:STAS-like domain-containing protein n=1 Tax=Marinomonas gallaica TaxID=1806667 RepID=UPI003CE554FD